MLTRDFLLSLSEKVQWDIRWSHLPNNAASHLHRYPNILLLPFEMCRTYSALSLFMQLLCVSPHFAITTLHRFSSFLVSDPHPPPPPPVSGPHTGDLCCCCYCLVLLQSQNLPMECSSQIFTRNHFHISSSVINIILISFRLFPFCLPLRGGKRSIPPKKQEKRVHHIFPGQAAMYRAHRHRKQPLEIQMSDESASDLRCKTSFCDVLVKEKGNPVMEPARREVWFLVKSSMDQQRMMKRYI